MMLCWLLALPTDWLKALSTDWLKALWNKAHGTQVGELDDGFCPGR